MAGGRPPIFENVEDLDIAIKAYFDDCDPHLEERMVEAGVNQRGETIWALREVMTVQKPYTMTGLALAIGVNRRTLMDWGTKDKFSHSIQRAKDRCEAFTETQLFGPYANGAKFILTNNYNGKYQPWSDKQEVDHKSDGKELKSLTGYSDEQLDEIIGKHVAGGQATSSGSDQGEEPAPSAD